MGVLPTRRCDLPRAGSPVDLDQSRRAIFAGLIHDVGALYLLSWAADSRLVIDDRPELHRLLVHWHETIGHALPAAMGLPEELVTVVGEHDVDRVVTKVKTLPDVLFVANKLANLEHGWRDPTLSEPVATGSLSELFGADAISALPTDSAEEVASWKSALGA